ncbi:MAG: hypothetical protein GY822_02115 [Deltaproteobacteria bacterium]|nr:hypothetical protein [Deltaproteobacteria bacterium]
MQNQSSLHIDTELPFHPMLAEVAAGGLPGLALDQLLKTCGTYELLEQWKQGGFYHDVVIRAYFPIGQLALSSLVIISTNCNGGVKEVLAFADLPDRYALWNARCPENDDFEGDLPHLENPDLALFRPMPTITADTRSEIKLEFRVRMRGGGWQMKKDVDEG